MFFSSAVVHWLQSTQVYS